MNVIPTGSALGAEIAGIDLSKDVSAAQRHAILREFFVDHGETVAGLDVEHEVDVVLEDLGQLERDSLGQFGIGGGLEQRAVDGRTRGAGVRLTRRAGKYLDATAECQ